MAVKYPKLSHEVFHRQLAEAQKDQKFRKEIREFIKATTQVYKLE